MTDQKITLNFIIAGISCVLITWVVHEFAHWLMCRFLDYEAMMYLNGTSVKKGVYPTDFEQMLISASGPIVTLIQGIAVYFFLNLKSWNKYFYLFLFTAFYMRFLAGLMNFTNLNDEGRISDYLGIGTFTIPILVSVFLFMLVYIISKKYSLKMKFHLWTTLIVMIASSILILTDQFIGIRII